MANSVKDLPNGVNFRIVGRPVTPHKSTKEGVEEMYFHITEPHTGKHGREYKAATVFARKIDGVWCMSVARCSATDAFKRAAGRSLARRRWFTGTPVQSNSGTERPRYEDALALYQSV